VLDRALATFGLACLALAVALGVWGWADRDGVDAARRVAADRQLDQFRCDRLSPVVIGLQAVAAEPDPSAASQIRRPDAYSGLGYDLQRVVVVQPVELETDLALLISEVNRVLATGKATDPPSAKAAAASARIRSWFARHCPEGARIPPSYSGPGVVGPFVPGSTVAPGTGGPGTGPDSGSGTGSGSVNATNPDGSIGGTTVPPGN
jgi:hypothetical protein